MKELCLNASGGDRNEWQASNCHTFKVSVPTTEHRGSSVATAPMSASTARRRGSGRLLASSRLSLQLRLRKATYTSKVASRSTDALEAAS